MSTQRCRSIRWLTSKTYVVVALAIVGLGLTSCGGGDGGGGDGGGGDGAGAPDVREANGKPEKTTLKVGALPITDLMQLYVAQSEGFFRREGLTVRIENFEGGAAIIPAVESGSVDLGWSNVTSILLARSRNLRFRFFAGGLYQGPDHWTSAIMVAKGSPIRRPEDLRGKSVAINTLKNINELAMRAYLDSIGLSPEAAKLIEVPFPDQPAAVTRGRVDAALPTEPFVTVAKAQGARVVDANPFRVLGDPSVFTAGFFASDDWLRENPNTAAAFRRAIDAATDWWNEHSQRHAEVIAQNTQVPPELAGRITNGEPRKRVTEEELQHQIDLSAKYGLIGESFAAGDVVAP